MRDQKECKSKYDKLGESVIDKEKRKEKNNLYAQRSFKETPIK